MQMLPNDTILRCTFILSISMAGENLYSFCLYLVSHNWMPNLFISDLWPKLCFLVSWSQLSLSSWPSHEQSFEYVSSSSLNWIFSYQCTSLLSYPLLKCGLDLWTGGGMKCPQFTCGSSPPGEQLLCKLLWYKYFFLLLVHSFFNH